MAVGIASFVNSFTNRLDAPLRQHLKNVYGSLALSTLAAGTGAYVHLFTDLLEASLLSALGALGLLIALLMTSDNGKNQKLRMGYLMGFAFLSGLGLGPLLEIAISIDPSIIITALLGSGVVFVSFSLSALYAPRGHWLFLGGALLSVSNITILLLLSNIFMRSIFVYQAQLYLGLALMCGFIIFDTQLIMEKFHMGDKDFIGHSLELFIDLFRLFRNLVEILAIKEQQKRKSKK